MLIRGVLLVGKFRTHAELNGMPTGEQRNALILELSKHSNLPVEHYQALDDTALAGKGAVMVFIREAKFRTDAELLSMSDGDQRNCVIIELNTQTWLPVSELQTMRDLDLISVGLGRFNSFIRGVLLVGKFRTHAELNGMTAVEQRNALIVELSKHSNLPVEHYQALDDTALAGKGAVMVFIREAKFRTDAELLSMSDVDQRNCVIIELNTQTWLPVSELQTMRDLDLILVGLGSINAEATFMSKYLELGGRMSILGLPTGPATQTGDMHSKSFQGGTMRLQSGGSVEVFEEYHTKVFFQGIHAFGTQRGPGADEPYAIVTVFPKDKAETAVTKKFGPFDDVDDGENAGMPTLVLDNVTPSQLVIHTILMENDEGDPEEVRKAVEKAMREAADQVLTAVGAVAGSPIPINIPDTWKNFLFGKLAGAITDLLGLGDDKIGDPDVIELDGLTLRHAHAGDRPFPPLNENGIRHTHASHLLTDGDAAYKVYFQVTTQRVT